MDKTIIAERFAEVLAKQDPYQHGVAIGYVDIHRESPNWTGLRYFLGTHSECEELFAEFFIQPHVEAAKGFCMTVTVN